MFYETKPKEIKFDFSTKYNVSNKESNWQCWSEKRVDPNDLKKPHYSTFLNIKVYTNITKDIWNYFLIFHLTKTSMKL